MVAEYRERNRTAKQLVLGTSPGGPYAKVCSGTPVGVAIRSMATSAHRFCRSKRYVLSSSGCSFKYPRYFPWYELLPRIPSACFAICSLVMVFRSSSSLHMYISNHVHYNKRCNHCHPRSVHRGDIVCKQIFAVIISIYKQPLNAFNKFDRMTNLNIPEVNLTSTFIPKGTFLFAYFSWSKQYTYEWITRTIRGNKPLRYPESLIFKQFAYFGRQSLNDHGLVPVHTSIFPIILSLNLYDILDEFKSTWWNAEEI